MALIINIISEVQRNGKEEQETSVPPPTYHSKKHLAKTNPVISVYDREK